MGYKIRKFFGWEIHPEGYVVSPAGEIKHCQFARKGKRPYPAIQGKWKVNIHKLEAGFYVINPCPGVFVIVDHIDNDVNNYNVKNLRWVTRAMNNLNRTTRPSFRKDHGNWMAKVQCTKAKEKFPDYVIGYYSTCEEAADAIAKRKTALWDYLTCEAYSEYSRKCLKKGKFAFVDLPKLGVFKVFERPE